ncbi:MAG TPA: hypothetical protein VFI45_02630 [Candidatus Acidoferrum sp.]|nr:hypothetical protein [Candidatus Acidoferrum sp.]
MTAKLKNPYRTSKDKPWMRQSWVVFLDILGFSAKILKATADGSAADLLSRLSAALQEAKRDLIPDPNDYLPYAVQDAPYVVKLFTDNIVLGFPIRDDGESEFGRMIQIVGLYQFSLLKHGFFIRGGITAGQLYMDEDMAFGKGLLDAHEAESKLARDPRVVLAPEAMDMVHHHLAYYADVAETPHNISLLVDSDGQLFLNYLFFPIDGSEEIPEEFLSDLRLHGGLIRACLEEFSSDPKVWPKYAWAGAYHNFFCGKFLNASELRIDPALLRQEPRQLGEVYRREGRKMFRGGEEVARFKSLKEWKVEKEPEG